MLDQTQIRMVELEQLLRRAQINAKRPGRAVRGLVKPGQPVIPGTEVIEIIGS